MELLIEISILVILFLFLQVKSVTYKALSLLIIFSLVLYYLEKSKDTFVTYNSCSFIPQGLTRRSCIDKCMTPYRPDHNSACNSENCRKICDDCVDESCKWKKPIGVPEPCKIRGISGNKNAKITWISPYNHGNKITAYSLFIINLQDLRTIRNDFPPEINCEVCEYIVGDLENDVEYQIYSLAKNLNGYSLKSNIVSVIPTQNQSIQPMDDIQNNQVSDIINISNETQKQFLINFQDNNLINKIRNKKGALFRTNEINLNFE